MLRNIVAFLLIGHAIAHAGLAAAPNPDDQESKPGSFFTQKQRSWFFQRINLIQLLVQTAGIILLIISVVGFILAGLGGLGIPGLNQIWHVLAGGIAFISLILLILFWPPWLIIGVVIDTGLVIFTLLNIWPS